MPVQKDQFSRNVSLNKSKCITHANNIVFATEMWIARFYVSQWEVLTARF